MKLTNLIHETFGRKFPRYKEQPDRRSKGAEIVYYIKQAMDKSPISRWEFSPSGNVVLYFGVIRHDSKQVGNILPRILRASEKYKFSFRLFADGNQIGMEILSGV